MDDAIFVDTNMFLRFFVRDVESFYKKAKELFENAENGKLKLETNEMVIAEIIWVLESYYDFSKIEIRDVVDTILETKNLKVSNHMRVKEAIELYASKNIDFIDAFNISYIKAKQLKYIATFDKKILKELKT
jgi:predicted nucleic-acid-binding protein